MNLAEYKILLVFSPSTEKEAIRLLLQNHGFTVDHSSKPELAIQKAVQILPDLIIYQNNLPGLTGFQAYNQLKTFLVRNRISFFIATRKFDQEELIIGMEMGIDNFILSPAEESSLLNKIDHQFHKQKEYLEAEKAKFKNSFYTTPVAKGLLHHLTMKEVNPPFKELFPGIFIKTSYPLISDIFDFSSPCHSLNLRKCLNGLIDTCNFERVPLHTDPNQRFDLHFFVLTKLDEPRFLVELTPSSQCHHYQWYPTVPGQSAPPDSRPHYRWNLNTIKLTRREEEVLDLSSMGLPLKQIAVKLSLSQRTIEKHRSNIMKKTNSNCILEAINLLKFNE